MQEQFLLYNSNDDQIKFILPNNVQEEGIIKHIESYKISKIKLIISWVLYLSTGGLLYLFTRWFLSLKLFLEMTKCKVKESQYLKITSDDNIETLEKTSKNNLKIEQKEQSEYLVFSYRLYTYYFDDSQNIFKPIQFDLTLLTNQEIHIQYEKGIQNQQQLNQLKALYGQNNTEIPAKSSIKILVDEVLSPFYMFQVFSVILWILEPYYYYASVIFFTSLISAVLGLIETRNNYIKLQKMSFFQTQVTVFREVNNFINQQDGQLAISEDIMLKKTNISSLDLVPGDIIQIPDGQIMPCDLILLNGSCVINESMLTGESIPIIKSALPYNKNKYNPNGDGKQSTIFAGTKCIETRYYLKGKIPVLGLVVQTSFNTMKGQLVRSILYPKQNSFQFYIDSLKFIAVLAFLAVLGFLASLYYQIKGYQDGYIELRDLILNSFDLVTITVPPALPTCLQIGISFALQRLKKKKIFCISPPKVNISGKVTIMCFDKTGTLTEEGLDMYGVRSVFYNQKTNKIHFTDLKTQCCKLAEQRKEEQSQIYQQLGDPELVLKECMASCHGLTRVQGTIIGDPLEVKMFEFTNWELIENQQGSKYDDLILAQVQGNKIDEDSYESVGILKRFEFSSKLQRMSTIVKSLQNQTQNQYRLYVKGSPEKIFELSKKETIPDNFHKVLDFYATKGFRVLGFGVRCLKLNYRQIQKVERDEIEKDLIFIGLIIMENKLKEITTQIINELQQANIRTIMVTGDNPLTAISVGRQCNIIHDKMRVYFGDMQDQIEQINWKDFDHSEKILDDENLQPVGGIEPFQEDGVQEIQKEKNLLESLKVIENDKKLSEYKKNISINQMRERFNENDENRSKSFDIMRKISRKENIQQQVENNENYLSDKIEIYSCSEAEEVQMPWINQENFSLAITGRAFSKMYHDSLSNKKKERLFHQMLNRTQIFARMKPEEKAQLLQSLQSLPHKPTCGMCGDGANDCGALKTADIGVSLSDAEASIAAPFTSKIQDISCITQVLMEGRAALVTSFSCFKFMALYSMIQFVCTTLLYTVGSLPADFQFLYWDVLIILPLAFLMGLTEAYPALSKQVPSSSLVSFQVLFSVISQSLIQAIFQIIVMYTIQSQSWYVSMVEAHGPKYENDLQDDQENRRKLCYEATILFYLTNFQYIVSCIAFSIGKPFKKPFYTNKYFTGALIFILIITLYIQIYPDQYTISFLYLFLEVKDQEGNIKKKMPYYWVFILIVFSLFNCVLSIINEKYLVTFLTHKCKKRKNNNNNNFGNQYNSIQYSREISDKL